MSEQYQEKLIREGNNMSVEEMIRQKKLRDTLRQQGVEIKSKLKDLIELAPFAIAGKKLMDLKNQIIAESNKNDELNDLDFIKDKFESIRSTIESRLTLTKVPEDIKREVSFILNDSIDSNLKEQKSTINRILLDLTSEETNGFLSIYDNLKHSYSLLFKQIVKEDRNNRIFLTKTLRKIADAESKDSDVLAKKYKTEKGKVDKRIKELSEEQNKIHSELGALRQELSTKSKVLSELTKTVSLDADDEKKDKVTSRLIIQLSEFIKKFKLEKKGSLETRIKMELNHLMHKESFISDVTVDIDGDLIDVHLIDEKGEQINKESLSKGEQQLYATALLKSLVDESGIQFPVFIDSPLQKFDKVHSKNIISKFYPSISKQVVLFPLLEKELTIKEYSLLKTNVSQTFRILNTKNKSIIKECDPDELFDDIEKIEDVYTH